MEPAFARAMAGATSAHQAAAAIREDTSPQRAGRRPRTSADPQRAQQGATAAAADAPAALQTLSRLQQLANASPQVAQLRRLQALADGRSAPVAQLAGGPEEEELIQGKFATAPLQPQLQQAPRANNIGLPDQLKSGIESLSGLSMDHVRVHYNSSQPAQLNALAYAQGSDIHIAPGQERHLPHEAWHVVQQAQGRVRPTMQMAGGLAVNDDTGLEREADVMGWAALAVSQQDVQQLQRQSNPAADDAGTYQLCKASELINLGRLWNTNVWMKNKENQDQDVRGAILEEVNDKVHGFSVGPVYQEYDLFVRGPGPGAYNDIVKSLTVEHAKQLQEFFGDNINLSSLDQDLKKLAIMVCVAEKGRGYSEQEFTAFLDKIVTRETNFASIEHEYPPSLPYRKDTFGKDGQYVCSEEDYSSQNSEEEYNFYVDETAGNYSSPNSEEEYEISGITRSGKRFRD
jgi:hypothetical protein